MWTNYIFFQIRFRSCFTHEYRLALGKYHAVRHITCAEGANIDLLEYPLIHRRRDDGPPAPRRSRPLFVTLSACHLSRYRESLPHKDCSFGRNRAKVEINILFKFKNPAYMSIIDLYAGFLCSPTNLSAAAANLLSGLCHRPCRRTISSLLSLLR